MNDLGSKKKWGFFIEEAENTKLICLKQHNSHTSTLWNNTIYFLIQQITMKKKQWQTNKQKALDILYF